MKRASKILRLTAVAALLGLLAFSAAWAGDTKTVTVTGSAVMGKSKAKARRQAIKDAKMAAIQAGVEVYVDSKTVVENFQVLKSQVFSSYKGYLQSSKVIKEGVSADGGSYNVTLEAVISTGKIKATLENLKLYVEKSGNPRVMVLYRQEKTGLEVDNPAVEQVKQTIQQALLDKSFRLVDEGSMAYMYSEIQKDATKYGDDSDLSDLVRRSGAEVYITFRLTEGATGGGYFRKVKATVRLKAIEVSNAHILGTGQAEGSFATKANTGTYDWYEALGKAGRQAAERASAGLVQKILQSLVRADNQGRAFTVIFIDYPVSEAARITTGAKTLPNMVSIQQRRSKPNYIEYEFFYSSGLGDLQSEISDYAKQLGIPARVISSEGSRITFKKVTQ